MILISYLPFKFSSSNYVQWIVQNETDTQANFNAKEEKEDEDVLIALNLKNGSIIFKIEELTLILQIKVEA